MKIISSFKDYYDFVMAYNQDDDYTYFRDPIIHKLSIKEAQKIINVDNGPFPSIIRPHLLSWPSSNSIITININYIGVTGVFYPTYELTTRNIGKTDHYRDYIAFNDLISYCDNRIELNKDVDYVATTLNKVKQTINTIQNNIIQNDEPFLKFNSPLLYIYGDVYKTRFFSKINNIIIETNPNLSNLMFYKTMDAFELYQQIRVYISNILVRDKQGDIPTGDDVVLAESKGFNKFSFRKDKTKNIC